MRERKKAKTRRTIQDHALRLFAEQGYDATTVDQIAEAAEISPSTFFRYFATKEDVVIEDEYDPLLIELFLGQPASLGPVAAMREAMRTAFAQIYPTEQGQLLQRTKLQLEVPAIRARALSNQFGMANVVAEAAARRYRRDIGDYEVQVFAGAYVGALIPAITRWAASDGKESLPELVDSALAHLEKGLELK
ncbi:TetR family transcriptional regulator [Rhizocola hellebori]|uniref:TetR family transcriptional regulator n=1 Tax=Rhizocola hellebori TaxID=1392758 RepID=A0A8J3QGH6_9ACTN|nr:TetR family transcriptional regulator [Rhizocola hellebori]